ncbi:hypothetical protein Tco_0914527 [Tanacetum coccineum]
MELQDIISSSLRKDMKELQHFQERLKEIKEECNKNIKWIRQAVEKINPESNFWTIRVFHVLFGKEFNSFREGFVRIMDYLELQLATEEVHECNSNKCLTALRKQFEKFLDDTSDYRIIRLLEGIENGIDSRVSHEEVLRIKERNVNERRKKERHVIELEMLKPEKMTQKGACSNTGNAQRAKLSKRKCLIHFRLLHTLLEDFSKEDLANACFSSGWISPGAFSSLIWPKS